MSWIDYYGLLICLWIALCVLMILIKKTRALGLSFAFFTAVLFIGLTGLQNYYGASTLYNDNKKQKFVELLQSEEEVSLNLTPTTWHYHKDGRFYGSDANIPLKYRKQIGIEFPLGSAPSVKTFYCSEDDGFISYVTDRFGFRNADEQWNNTAHDILILGDSFAESACIPTAFQTNFAPRLKVVSLGKGGNGPLTSLAAFIEYNNRFKAEKVYFFVYPNDYSRENSNPLAIDLEIELEEPQLRKYLVEPNSIQDYFNESYLQAYKSFAVEYSKSRAEWLDGSQLNQILRPVSYLFFYEFLKSTIQTHMVTRNFQGQRFIESNELEKVYKKAIHTADKISSKLIFVTLPYKGSECEGDVIKMFVDDILVGLNANVLDLWSDLCDKKYFANSGSHFNKLGYKVLADRIEEDFLKN